MALQLQLLRAGSAHRCCGQGRRDRGPKFVRPYRNIGELNPTEQLKLQRHPFEVAQAVIDTYSKQGGGSINVVPARWSG